MCTSLCSNITKIIIRAWLKDKIIHLRPNPFWISNTRSLLHGTKDCQLSPNKQFYVGRINTYSTGYILHIRSRRNSQRGKHSVRYPATYGCRQSRISWLILAPPGERKLLFLFHKLILQGRPSCFTMRTRRRSAGLQHSKVLRFCLLLDVPFVQTGLPRERSSSPCEKYLLLYHNSRTCLTRGRLYCDIWLPHVFK